MTGLDGSDTPNAGAYLSPGGSSWQAVSARSAKHDVDPVDPEAVLDGVRDLEVSTWSYDASPGVSHMGPMAGDFHDAFAVGEDPETIGHVDADGVALAAIKGLADEVEQLEDECEQKDDRIDDLESELERKDERIDDLESRLDDIEAMLEEGE